MAKFKIGDRVRRIRSPHINGVMQIGTEWVVNRISKHNQWIYVVGCDEQLNPDNFELINPNETAIKQLEALGYTIIPPKPKETGKIYILRGRSGITITDNPSAWSSELETIAIVDWTEGDGL